MVLGSIRSAKRNCKVSRSTIIGRQDEEGAVTTGYPTILAQNPCASAPRISCSANQRANGATTSRCRTRRIHPINKRSSPRFSSQTKRSLKRRRNNEDSPLCREKMDPIDTPLLRPLGRESIFIPGQKKWRSGRPVSRLYLQQPLLPAWLK